MESQMGEIRGAGHVGPNRWFGYRGRWSVVSLSVTPNSLTFKLWPVSYTFTRSSIRGLVKKRVLGRPSLFIVHSNPHYPKSVYFQPAEFGRLESLLRSAGYTISEHEPEWSATNELLYSRTISVIAFLATIAGVIAVVAAVFVLKAR
jgi:hypothetical protein